jgi:hypothetical protein
LLKLFFVDIFKVITADISVAVTNYTRLFLVLLGSVLAVFLEESVPSLRISGYL